MLGPLSLASTLIRPRVLADGVQAYPYYHPRPSRPARRIGTFRQAPWGPAPLRPGPEAVERANTCPAAGSLEGHSNMLRWPAKPRRRGGGGHLSFFSSSSGAVRPIRACKDAIAELGPGRDGEDFPAIRYPATARKKHSGARRSAACCPAFPESLSEVWRRRLRLGRHRAVQGFPSTSRSSE